ncbi:gp456 [Bacillus phage G]|uniref:Gp456 n=1 Tax=Bacillus phage G TaxID=2884420 RepID=G3MAJ7_9CAUD|nr:gp456 [Bacillus phage G]AEO93714.1 gp456 [Bacillus phage G]
MVDIINFGGIPIKADRQMYNKLSDILENCDSIHTELEYQSSFVTSYKVIIIKNNQSIEFNISMKQDMSLFIIKINDHEKHRFKIMTILSIISNKLLFMNDEKMIGKLKIICCKQESRCPICNSELSKSMLKECVNGCYYLMIYDKTVFYATVFNETFDISGDESTIEEKINTINKLYDKINYWKENDKYLTNILSN